MRLTGIIDYTMDNFLCVRGFASMLELSEISKPDKNIQRDLIEGHKGEMEAFLSDGKFTFFPEVILGVNMKGSENDIDKINCFREDIYAEKVLKKMTINNIKYTVKKHLIKKENNNLAYDIIQTIIMEFDKLSIIGKEFIRIDGNHRLSAVSKSSSYANKRIPYCLLLFRDDTETDKFCRAIFYNINTKQIPLKMEQNLKVIMESEQVFNDEILKTDPSFGFHYFLTRQIIKEIDLANYPFVKILIEKSKFTYFVEVIGLLLEHKLIKKNDKSIHTILNTVSEINEALRSDVLVDVSQSLAIIGHLLIIYYLINVKQVNF